MKWVAIANDVMYQLKSFPNIFPRLFLICHNIPIVATAGLSLIISEHLCASVPLSNLLSSHPSAQMQYVCLECYCCSFTAHASVGLTNEMLPWWWVPHCVISCLFMARFLLGNMCLDLRGNLGCDIQAPWCPLCLSVLSRCFTVCKTHPAERQASSLWRSLCCTITYPMSESGP